MTLVGWPPKDRTPGEQTEGNPYLADPADVACVPHPPAVEPEWAGAIDEVDYEPPPLLTHPPTSTPDGFDRRGDDAGVHGRTRAHQAPKRGLGADPAAGEYEPALALRGISGHLTRTSEGVMAWYRLRPRPWSMRPDSEREALMAATGLALTQLTGRWLHWRVLWSPFPAAEWARRHDQWARPLPDRAGGSDWTGWLVACQRAALRHPHAVKQVYLGVEVHAGRRALGRFADRMSGVGPRRWRELIGRLADAELAALDEEIIHLDRVLASSALAGTPASAEQMLVLLYRSCGLGLPASAAAPTAPHGQWEATDLAGPAGTAHWSAEPYAPSVRIDGVAPGGQRVTRHVVVASLGRMGELDVPAEHLPWMTIPDTLGAGVEWSARLRILEHERAARQLRHAADRVDAQERHYTDDHQLPAPPYLARQINLAAQVRDDLDTDHSGLSARCEGWWRLAISAESETDALAAVDELRAAYHPDIAVERGEAQYATAREFIPGEPLATRAYRRRMSVRHLAMAMPQVTDIIGDDHGPLLFTTAASGRPVAWDPWGDIDTRQVSGLTPIIGGLGAGKTFLMGALAYHAVRATEAYVTLLDPSGPLTRLAELPELAGHARAVSLLDSPPGTLNPYRLVPAPDRGHYAGGPAGDAEHAHDTAAADARRTTLVISVLTGLLPASIRRDGDTQALLLDAIGQVGSHPGHDPRQVLDALARMGTEGRRLGGAFAPILGAAGPARLLLGHPDGQVGGWDPSTDRLLVISTRGLSLPREGADQADWSLDEQLSLALMHLTSWLTYHRVHQLPVRAPKLVGLDELRALALLPSGRMLVQQFARDNRKRRVRVCIAGQLASDVLRLGGEGAAADSGLAGLCHDILVGRTTGDTAQAEALRLLRIPTGVGYEQQLGQLSTPPTGLADDVMAADAPREFLWRSGDLCELVCLDATGPHLAALRQALDTNAARAGYQP